MARTVGIGNQDFEVIRSRGYFYIDKTDFIREWWESGDSVTLIARPRRFGKTLNMSMLEKFFDLKHAGKSALFQGLSIWQREEYRALQGTYPVLFLSFAVVKENTFTEARKSMCRVIEEQYNKHDYLLEGNLLNDKEKAYYGEVRAEMSDSTAAASLRSLSDFLSRYYGKKVIVLLDEYDTPMQEAFEGGYWEEMVAFVKSLFNAAFKTNPYLERAVMTGITRVSKESIFSDLNNLQVVTTTSEKYADCFGFTEEEVFNALDEYGLGNRKDQVKNWYDGFTFGSRQDIYNPWSIINYLDKKRLSTYWANTSSNGLVDKLIREGSVDIKISMENLLKGEHLYKEVDEQIIFDQLDADENAIWSLFLASGYLKAESYELNEDTGADLYELALTNKEVQIMFQKMIRKWFTCSGTVYNGFIRALLQDDVKSMNAYMNRVALATFSYFDSGRNPSMETQPERFYHGFVLGLVVELADRYIITSNRESGFGRYDVMLEPCKKEDPAFVLEFKVHDPEDEDTLEDTVQEALKQIRDKNYDSELIARGIEEGRIRHLGFAFEGKRVLIG